MRRIVLTEACHPPVEFRMPFRQLIVLACMLFAPGAICQENSVAKEKDRILFVHGDIPPASLFFHALDPVLKRRLDTEGFETRTTRYEEVTPDLLRAFHAVVLMQEPSYGQSFVTESDQVIYRSKVPLFLEYVKEGGGLYVTHDAAFNPQAQDCDLLNETLLKPLGAGILSESIIDPLNTVSHTARLLPMDYASTSNFGKHPITGGVSTIWYPVGPSGSVRDTTAIRHDEHWRVIVRGEPGSFSGGNGVESERITSPGAYPDAPPMAAVRQWGKGRILVFPSAARCWIHSAYHPELAGYVLEKGDGFRFLTQALRWLSEPRAGRQPAELPPESSSHGKGRRPVRERASLTGAALDQLVERGTRLKPFVGVVGLDSRRGSVEEYVAAAKVQKLDFIAFADDYADLDNPGYERLVEACHAATTADFVALPGIRYATDSGATFVALDLPRLPSLEVINRRPLGSNEVRKMSNLMPLAPTVKKAPGFAPYTLREWNAVDVKPLDKGELLADGFSDYRWITSNMQMVVPLATQRVESPAALDTQAPWKTAVLAESIDRIRSSLVQGKQRTFITSGPLIRQFAILNPAQGARWDGAAFWNEGDLLFLKVQADSDAPLRSITLFSGEELFRQFEPGSRAFETTIQLQPARDASFWMIVEDERGRLAISSPLLLRNFVKRFNWCTDQQNLICWNYDEAEDERGNMNDGIYGYNVSHNPGRGDVLEPNVPGRQAFSPPPGRELAMGSMAPKFKGLRSWPAFLDQNGVPVDSPPHEGVMFQNRLIFNSADAYVLDLIWDKDTARTPMTPHGAEYFEWRARYINPRGKPYEPNFWLIETEVRILKEITLGHLDRPELVLLDAFFTEAPLNRWPRYFMQSKKGALAGATGFMNGKTTIESADLDRFGYVALLGNAWFSPALFAADPQDYAVRIGDSPGAGGMLLGKRLPEQTFRAGETFTNRFLYAVITDKEVSSSADEQQAVFDRIHRAYGFGQPPAYAVNLRQGTVLDQVFALQIQADNGAVSGEIGAADLPSSLLVRIEGLNPNWSAFVVDLDKRSVRSMGVCETTGITTVRCDRAQRLFLGHPFVCDNSGIRMETTIEPDGTCRMALHNPGATTAEVSVHTQPDLAEILPTISQSATLAPGETKLFQFDRSTK